MNGPYEALNRMRGMPAHMAKPPIELEFLGWRADTHMLARAGWDIAESEVPNYREPWTRDWMLTMRHREAGLHATMDDGIPFNWLFHHHGRGMHRSNDGYGPHRVRIQMRIAREINMMMRPNIDPAQMFAVDARINYDERASMHMDPYRLATAPYFPSATDTKSIWLKEATMQEVLDVALSKQEPQQEEIRKKMVHRQEMAEMNRAGREEARLILMA